MEIGKTPPFGRRVSTQFLVFPISTRVDITVYQHGKCFIFLKCESQPSAYSNSFPVFPIVTITGARQCGKILLLQYNVNENLYRIPAEDFMYLLAWGLGGCETELTFVFALALRECY